MHQTLIKRKAGADASVLRELTEEFRALQAICRTLRADWDYVVRSGEPGQWRLAGAVGAGPAVRFAAAARRAAIALGLTGPDLLVAWLEFMRVRSRRFEFGRCGVEQNADGSEGNSHLCGTIWRVCEASAECCSELEGMALETDRDIPSVSEPKLIITPELPDLRDTDPVVRLTEEQSLLTQDTSTESYRRAAVDAFVEKTLRETGKRITRADIWRSAGYKTRAEFERWERCDKRATNAANRNFTRILDGRHPLR